MADRKFMLMVKKIRSPARWMPAGCGYTERRVVRRVGATTISRPVSKAWQSEVAPDFACILRSDPEQSLRNFAADGPAPTLALMRRDDMAIRSATWT